MARPRIGSRGRSRDDSRSYVVVVVVAHKSPQLRFSNLLENFAEEISERDPACRRRDTAPNFSPTKMNKFSTALFSSRVPCPAVSQSPCHIISTEFSGEEGEESPPAGNYDR